MVANFTKEHKKIYVEHYNAFRCFITFFLNSGPGRMERSVSVFVLSGDFFLFFYNNLSLNWDIQGQIRCHSSFNTQKYHGPSNMCGINVIFDSNYKIIKAWTRAMAVEIEGVAILGLRCGLEKHWFWVRGGSHLRRLRILTEVPGLWMTSLAKNWSKLRSGDEFSLGHTAFVRPVGHSRGWEQNTVE